MSAAVFSVRSPGVHRRTFSGSRSTPRTTQNTARNAVTMSCSLSRKRSVGAGTEIAITVSLGARPAMAGAEIPGVCSPRSKAMPVRRLGDLPAETYADLRVQPRGGGFDVRVVEGRQRRFPVGGRLQREPHADRRNHPEPVRGLDLVDEAHALAGQHRQVDGLAVGRACHLLEGGAEHDRELGTVGPAETQEALARGETGPWASTPANPTSTRPTINRRIVDLASPSRSPRSIRRSRPGSAAISSSAAAARRNTWMPSSRPVVELSPACVAGPL